MKTPADLTATEAARKVRDGELTSEALVEACIARIEEREPDVQAWHYFDPDMARTQARQADARKAAGEPLGLLHGIPVGIKDIINTSDMPTEDGTPANKGRQPEHDATCVGALRAAGAVIMGKTVTTELATRHPGKTRNPHNIAHTPGGSSSGSAAAVACGMVPLALGTQTVGSVTRPASFCGIHGLKPTLGLISRTGVTMQSHTLDTVGVYGRGVADLALIADVLSGADPTDEVSYPRARTRFCEALGEPITPPPKFAFLRTPAWTEADPSAQTAITDFVGKLAGCIQEHESPASFSKIIEAHQCVQAAENVHHFAQIEARARNLLSQTMQDHLDMARTVTAGSYLGALAVREGAYAELSALLDRSDAVVCLSSCGPAPKGHDWTGDPIFNGMWTFLGVPSVTLPLLSSGGLPFGIQVICKRREDSRAMRLAQWLEQKAMEAGAATWTT